MTSAPKIGRGRLRPYYLPAAAAVCLYALHLLNLFNFHELGAVDLRFKLRGQRPADPRIVIVTIDDESLRRVGQWPWPRSLSGQLLHAISRYHPRLIYPDILFTEASPDPREDEVLALAVKKAGNVILPSFVHSQNPTSFFFPIPPLAQNALATGFANVEPEKDAVIRKFLPSLKTREGFYPSAPLALALQLRKSSGEPFPKLPLDRSGRMWIRFPGSIDSFQRVSAWQVLNVRGTANEELEKLFSNRIVLIGHTAAGTYDLKPSPFSPVEPGVAILASALDSLLRKSYLRSAPAWLDFTVFALLLFLIAGICQKTPPKESLVATLAVIAVYFIVNVIVFLAWGMIFSLYLPIAGILLTYVLTLFLKYVEIRFQGELLNRELQTAAKIQESFLSHSQPEMTGIDMAFDCRFAKQVGGDLYDWRQIDDHRLAVCLGDVSGKGCPAALYMSRAINELRHQYHHNRTPGGLHQALNSVLSEGETAGMFVTLFSALIDTQEKKLWFSSAGHEPMVYFSALSKKAVLTTEAQGIPIGLFGEALYETGEITYQAGDALFVITDGIRELRNPKKEEYGPERLKKLLEREASGGAKAAEIIRKLFVDMDEYRKGTSPHDDQTVLCIRF
jgi:CHASE2 domain-containing sensor protein